MERPMAPDACAAEDSIVWHLSLGEEAFGPLKACFPSVGECQGAEAEKCDWEREHLHVGNGSERGDAIGLKG